MQSAKSGVSQLSAYLPLWLHASGYLSRVVTCCHVLTVTPFIIMKGKVFNQAWFYQGLPSTWTFSVSANGWTANQIGLQWIQHFEKHTRTETTGSKRLQSWQQSRQGALNIKFWPLR
jgi:hypothetical protein